MMCAPSRSGGSGRAPSSWLSPAYLRRRFLEATQPALTNYIPIIRHPAYDVGLLVLAFGALAPVVRLLLNLPGRLASAPPFAVAMALGGFVYVLALICFAVATTLLAHAGELASREELFWGGGHVLQFVYAALMVTNWWLLARMSLGEKAVDSRIFLGSVGLIALIAIAAPVFYAVFAPFSDNQREAFRFLQFGIAAPTLIFAVSLVTRALRAPAPWPWRDPAFFALAMSLALFALGGVMGFLIDGSDTRTPAHYHAVITAVSVSSAGMLLTYGLKELGQGACAATHDAAAHRPLRRRPVRRLDRHVRRWRLWRVAQNAVRRRIARHRRRRGHGGARDRFDLHHPGRRGFCDRRHPGVVAALASPLDGVSLTAPNFERARALVSRTRARLCGLGPVRLVRPGRLAGLLHLGRAQVNHRETEESERQRLMRQRKLDRNDCEQRRDAERDLEQSNRRNNHVRLASGEPGVARRAAIA